MRCVFVQDFEAHRGPSESEDVIQANNKPSTMTDRGHQNPSAFLIMASGLDSVSREATRRSVAGRGTRTAGIGVALRCTNARH